MVGLEYGRVSGVIGCETVDKLISQGAARGSRGS